MSLAEVIDGLQFACEGGELSGTLDLGRLPRLVESGCSTDGIAYRLRGGVNRAGSPSLSVKASGHLDLVCQRCLGPLGFDLDVDVELEMCADPQKVADAEDEVDRILAEGEMDVAQLVEDEVILALPLAPRHEKCAAADQGAQVQKISPFSALAALKKRPD